MQNKISTIIFLLFISTSCSQLIVDKEYDVSYLIEYLDNPQINFQNLLKYDNGVNEKYLAIKVQNCNHCFMPYKTPDIISSYIALTIFSQGIEGYDGIEVECFEDSNKSSYLSSIVEYTLADLESIKELNRQLIKEKQIDTTHLTCKLIGNEKLEFKKLSYKNIMFIIEQEYTDIVLMGFLRKSEITKQTTSLVFQLSNGDNFGVLIANFNEISELESLYYSTKFSNDFHELINIFNEECKKKDN